MLKQNLQKTCCNVKYKVVLAAKNKGKIEKYIKELNYENLKKIPVIDFDNIKEKKGSYILKVLKTMLPLCWDLNNFKLTFIIYQQI